MGKVIKSLISSNGYNNTNASRSVTFNDGGTYLVVSAIGGASGTNYGAITTSGGTALSNVHNSVVSTQYSGYQQFIGTRTYIASGSSAFSISSSFQTPNHCRSTNVIAYELNSVTSFTSKTNATYTSEGTRTYTLDRGIYIVTASVVGGFNDTSYATITASANKNAVIENFENVSSIGSGDYQTYLGTACFEIEVIEDGTSLTITTLRNGSRSVAVVTQILQVNSYFVSSLVNPIGTGTISTGGYYGIGSVAEIEAIANNGYDFSHWDIDVTIATIDSTKGSYYTMNRSNLSVYGAVNNWFQATFTKPAIITGYQGVNYTDNGYGRTWDMTLKGSNDGTTWETIQTNAMAITGGSVSVVNDTPYLYYRWYFSRYNNTHQNGRYIFDTVKVFGDVIYTSYDNPLLLEINGDTLLTANFLSTIVISLNYDALLGSASYEWTSATEITLSATPNADAQFIGYYVNSVLISTNPTYTYVVLGNTTIEARFEPIYEITEVIDGLGAIQYTRGADQNDVTFSVIPNANWHFLKYEVGGVEYTTTPLSLHLSSDITITAYFEEDDKYHISIPTNVPHTSVFISDNDVYAGTLVTLWARPFPDYNFIKWGDGEITNPRQIIVNENITLSAEYQRVTDSNGIYQYRCFIKDQLDLTDPPKAFLVVDTFDVNVDLLTNATSSINVMELSSNINEGDVLVLYDPKGQFIYNGVITSIEDLTINCSQMQTFYHGNWIYNVHPSASLEEEIAWLLGQYAQGKLYKSTYTDTLVAQRLGGITIDYTDSIIAKLPNELDDDGNEEMNIYDMEEFIYDLYQRYSIIFDFEINFSGTNYVHIKVPTYQKLSIGNNMYAVQDMQPITEIEETNKLVIFNNDKTYRTTYIATKTGIVENPVTDANRFNITNTEIVFSDDASSDLVSANLPNTMYNHKLTFTLVIKNFIYEFGDFNLGGELDVYYNDDYYASVLTGYQITKESNRNITEAIFTCGKVRIALTKMLTMGVL